jgi:tetrahydromethanopterin S-methyltransferase subunit G
MSEHLLRRNLMERLERVDSKLEQLLAHQILPQDEDLVETQPSPDEKFSEDVLVADWEDEKIHTAAGFSERSKNPLPFRVAVSAQEADSIFQKVDKINRDVEVMERVEKLERQNRKIVILGSMSITLAVLTLGVFVFLLTQANLFNRGVLFPAKEKVAAIQPSAGVNPAKVQAAKAPEPFAQTNDFKAAESVAKFIDPSPAHSALSEPDPKPAKATAPVKYVGYMGSNKYHYPTCKWAAQIKNYKHLTFSSIKEARGKGYIPCPTCKPPHSD